MTTTAAFTRASTGENFEKNIALVREVEAMAREKGCTTAQLALAWVLAQGRGHRADPGDQAASDISTRISARWTSS